MQITDSVQQNATRSISHHIATVGANYTYNPMCYFLNDLNLTIGHFSIWRWLLRERVSATVPRPVARSHSSPNSHDTALPNLTEYSSTPIPSASWSQPSNSRTSSLKINERWKCNIIEEIAAFRQWRKKTALKIKSRRQNYHFHTIGFIFIK